MFELYCLLLHQVSHAFLDIKLLACGQLPRTGAQDVSLLGLACQPGSCLYKKPRAGVCRLLLQAGRHMNVEGQTLAALGCRPSACGWHTTDLNRNIGLVQMLRNLCNSWQLSNCGRYLMPTG